MEFIKREKRQDQQQILTVKTEDKRARSRRRQKVYGWNIKRETRTVDSWKVV